jgi:Na+-transporting NADH:ubiquinone oxidoreductase subunit A
LDSLFNTGDNVTRPNSPIIKITKGLNLPIQGEPDQVIDTAKEPQAVALLGCDYVGLKPRLAVKESETVDKGQLLFTDRNMPAVRFTAPGAGTIEAIHRDDRRTILAIVIQLSGNREFTFEQHSENQLPTLKREEVIEQLLDSGLWTALRTRPFSKVPNPETLPHSIFINAMDTDPLAPIMDQVLSGQERDLANGMRLIAKLTDGPLFICKAPETPLPEVEIDTLRIREFSGVHPAGNVGTHIHFLDPVHRGKSVWHIGIQDVIAVGRLFATGRLDTDRVVALAGPSVTRPRLIRTRLGASLDDLTAGELKSGEHRVISGSVLSGHHAAGPVAFIGRYHQQISVIPEERKRELLGWLKPGLDRFSVKNVMLSALLPGRKFALTTSLHGEVRAILPSGNYERLMPLDIMPLFLIRALAVGDTEESEQLGCLELDEEDLALCAFACPSKQEFGPMLRRTLRAIEDEELD